MSELLMAEFALRDELGKFFIPPEMRSRPLCQASSNTPNMLLSRWRPWGSADWRMRTTRPKGVRALACADLTAPLKAVAVK
ncbi:hypothetical protein PSP20601_05054 [Pandoraea sputorum]|nr:hypothetical protein PSP20601_05054 [Pandoraea sputorum]